MDNWKNGLGYTVDEPKKKIVKVETKEPMNFKKIVRNIRSKCTD